MNENVFENSIINALENYLQHQEDYGIKPLSEDFFDRIEAIKQRSKE